MVKHKIIPDGKELNVRIYDATASGWRILFVERGGEIGRYLDQDQALTSIDDYDRSDKGALFEAELEVYLESARTGKAIGDCGLSALVRFGDHAPHSYATFILPEDFVRKSELKIIGFGERGQIHSAGWT